MGLIRESAKKYDGLDGLLIITPAHLATGNYRDLAHRISAIPDLKSAFDFELRRDLFNEKWS